MVHLTERSWMERTPRGAEQDKSYPDVELLLCVGRHSSLALREHRCEELTPYLAQQSVSTTQTLKYSRSARANTQLWRSGEVRNKVCRGSNIRMAWWLVSFARLEKIASCPFEPVLHWPWKMSVYLVHHFMLRKQNFWYSLIPLICHQCFLMDQHTGKNLSKLQKWW